MGRFAALIFSLFFGICSGNVAIGADSGIGTIPVQDSGRVKPFESFARETLQLVYGKQTYNGRDATEIVFTWGFLPDFWIKQPIIKIDSLALKQALNLGEGTKYFALAELLQNPRLPALFSDLRVKISNKERLTAFYNSIQSLNNQMTALNMVLQGQAYRMVPASAEDYTQRWLAMAEFEGKTLELFRKIFVALTEAVGQGGEVKTITAEGAKKVKAAVDEFESHLTSMYGSYYDVKNLKAELTLQKIQPFTLAWILYLVASLLLLISCFGSQQSLWAWRTGIAFTLLAFLVHTVGFALRIYIVGRPPVSNMYETVVWAPWGTVIFASILEYFYKKRIIILGANISAILCLILASFAPKILDPSLHPLEPVLRSNFWLTTHVLVIVLSYGAFFLAWVLGNAVVTACLVSEKKSQKFVKDGGTVIYRANQIGTVLLFVGIVLGGIWADYSWGRFWGWDPKETWALIAFLGYMAVIHAKLSGWFKDFGMAAASVVAFSLVIMAWYGVNYVLTEGLHAYGFGAGGVEYVASAVGIQLAYVAFVAGVRQSRIRAELKH